MVWTHAGGQIEKTADDDTAFAFRGARFIPEIKSIWDFNRPQDMRANVEWAYDFFEELATLGNGPSGHAVMGAYLNYIDPLLVDWQMKYYGKNYDRLVKTKRACDPTELFRFQQGVGSKFNPSPKRPLDLSPLQNS